MVPGKPSLTCSSLTGPEGGASCSHPIWVFAASETIQIPNPKAQGVGKEDAPVKELNMFFCLWQLGSIPSTCGPPFPPGFIVIIIMIIIINKPLANMFS